MITITRKSLKTLALLLALTAFGYGGYLLIRGTDMAMPSLFPAASGKRLLMSMDGFTFLQSDHGSVSWRMSARNADLFENKEAQLKDLEIIYTGSDDKEKRQATLLGEHGTMDTVTGNASVRRGNRDVRIATSDGYLLTTSFLSWNALNRLVWTSEPFKLLGKEMYLEGVGISANVDMRTVQVKHNVKAVLQD